jgi:hypothetical protein
VSGWIHEVGQPGGAEDQAQPGTGDGDDQIETLAIDGQARKFVHAPTSVVFTPTAADGLCRRNLGPLAG